MVAPWVSSSIQFIRFELQSPNCGFADANLEEEQPPNEPTSTLSRTPTLSTDSQIQKGQIHHSTGLDQVREDAWDRFVPFLQHPPAARKVIYRACQAVAYWIEVVYNRRRRH